MPPPGSEGVKLRSWAAQLCRGMKVDNIHSRCVDILSCLKLSLTLGVVQGANGLVQRPDDMGSAGAAQHGAGLELVRIFPLLIEIQNLLRKGSSHPMRRGRFSLSCVAAPLFSL